jgi:4-amino-4-deoxy-L-arabinose transferase-like glycosyltransferase
VGAWQAWNSRYHMNADGISYLDIGDTYFRGDWKMAINAYWSPLYSWLLGMAMHFLKPSPYNEFPLVHLVNFAIYLLTVGCFHFFLMQLIHYHQFRQDKTSGNCGVSFPEWAWIALGYSLFLHSSLNMITISEVTPDMCVAAFVYLACGIFLRIRRGSTNYLTFALLGIVLGFGYLAKAVMFPLAFIFLSLSVFSIGNFRKALPRTIIALIGFLFVAGPFIIAISYAKGRFTYGDTAKFNYHLVSKFKVGRYWDGTQSGTGTPRHSPRQILNVPKVYEFGTPIAGTYPIWYDPSYWYDGLEISFNLENQLRVFQSTIKSYYRIFYPDYSILFVTIFILYLMSRRRWLIVKDIAEHWSLLIPAIMALSMYFLVFAASRYVAPFILLLWLGVFSGIRLPDSEESRRLLRYITILIVLVMMITSTRQLIKNRHHFPDNTHWRIADAIKQMGVLPGDKVASIGYSHPHFWARLARVRIVAEIPDENVDYFWKAKNEAQFKVIDTFAGTGAKVIVTKIRSNQISPVDRQKIVISDSYFDWQQIANSDYYVYKIPCADTLSPASPISVFDDISPEYFKTD